MLSFPFESPHLLSVATNEMDGRTGNGVYTFVLRPGADYERKLFKLKIGEFTCSVYTEIRVHVGAEVGQLCMVCACGW